MSAGRKGGKIRARKADRSTANAIDLVAVVTASMRTDAFDDRLRVSFLLSFADTSSRPSTRDHLG